MKKFVVIFLSIVALGLAMTSLTYAGEVIDGEYLSDEALEKRRLFEEAINNPPPQVEGETFTGYGRVIDQNGDPISNAKVEVHWKRIEIIMGIGFKVHVDEEWVATDPNGYFSVTTPNGAIPSFWQVEANGYESQVDISPYNQNDNEREAMMKNSMNDPIILHMRKLNPTTFLLKSKSGYYFSEPTTTLSYTMIPGLMRQIKPDLSNIRKPIQKDLVFSVNKNEDGSYTLHIRLIPKNGGSMQLLDEYLYESPADGYQPNVTLTIRPEDGEVTKYLYFTSRKTAVYSRMTVGLKVRSSDGMLDLDCNTWTNPYGKRNLEWEPDLPFDAEEHFRREAQKALNEGTLPPEPENLQALIDQYNGK